MTHEDNDRQPRWNTAGYWTNRREGEDWPGDRSNVREYDREDIRRYNRRSLEQGEELRHLRGQRFRIEPGWVYPEDRRPGDDLVDNYWGRREMNRDYTIRDRGAWWNNVGGRPDLPSARYYRNDLPTSPRFDWIEDQEYDLDPGYEYEFGTDFDFLESMQGVPNRQDTMYRSPWYVPGPFAGFGPAGYHPSDERIKENICEMFYRNGYLDCSKLDVQVKNGVVRLNGNVNRRAEKYLAEDIASSASGVIDIDNRIRYKFKGGSTG